MKKFLFSLLLLLVMHSATSQSYQANIKVVFPFSTTNVVFNGWDPDFSIQMQPTGPNQFETTVYSNSNGNLIFNISYDIPSYNLNNQWIASGNSYANPLFPERLDAHGLKYARVYINNQLISNLYTIENGEASGLDISVKFSDYNSISPFINNTHPHLITNDLIPTEAHHHYSFRNIAFPLSTDVSVLGWIIALSDNNFIDSSSIEVDYIKVYGFLDGDSTLLCDQEYSSFDPVNDGGLYLRYPFFPAGFDEHDPLPASVSQGILTFYPSSNRHKVWHLWSERFYSPSGFQFDAYKIHCRARISGHAVIQAGIDFRDASETTHELGVSNWHFHKNGQWQDIIFDTRSIITSSSSSAQSDPSIQVHYNSLSHSFDIRFQNILPGLRTINLFNANGQLIHSQQINFTSSKGSISLSAVQPFSGSLLYSVIGHSDFFRGKINFTN